MPITLAVRRPRKFYLTSAATANLYTCSAGAVVLPHRPMACFVLLENMSTRRRRRRLRLASAGRHRIGLVRLQGIASVFQAPQPSRRIAARARFGRRWHQAAVPPPIGSRLHRCRSISTNCFSRRPPSPSSPTWRCLKLPVPVGFKPGSVCKCAPAFAPDFDHPRC